MAGILQKIAASIERRGTKWIFRAYCKRHWFSSWCDPRCWAAAKRAWGIWAKRAATAKLFCRARKG